MASRVGFLMPMHSPKNYESFDYIDGQLGSDRDDEISQVFDQENSEQIETESETDSYQSYKEEREELEKYYENEDFAVHLSIIRSIGTPQIIKDKHVFDDNIIPNHNEAEILSKNREEYILLNTVFENTPRLYECEITARYSLNIFKGFERVYVSKEMLTAYQCERITPKYAGNDWDVYCIGPKYAFFNENFHFLKNSLQIATQNIFICDPKFCDCADTDTDDEDWN